LAKFWKFCCHFLFSLTTFLKLDRKSRNEKFVLKKDKK
jgi:hypothetical protein